MVSLRTFALVFALLAAASLSAGTTGFSALSAERSVQVAVVEDDQAYVGVDVCDPKGNQGASNDGGANQEESSTEKENTGTDPVFLHVSNQYTEPVSVSVATEDADIVASNSPQVGVGNQKRFEVKLDDATDSLTVDVSAPGFEASITRPVTSSTGCGRSDPSKQSQTGQQRTDTNGEGETASSDDTASETAEADDDTDGGDGADETETPDR